MTEQHTAGNDAHLLATRLRQVLAVDPSATALAFEGTEYQWSFYAEAMRCLDETLAAFGDARRVGIVLHNRPGPLAVVVAAVATERQVVTLSPYLGDEQLADDIRRLSPDVIIASETDWARPGLQAAAAEIGAVGALTSDERALAPRAAQWKAAPALRPMDDVAVVMMTSGTTGRPKHISLSHRQLAAAFDAAGTPVDGEGIRLHRGFAVLWSSLTHIGGMYFAIAHALEGRPVALMQKFDVGEWTRVVRTYRPGYVRLPPAPMRMVLTANVPADVFESVRAVGVGTAPCPPELSSEFERRYGVPVLVMYGATEFAGAVTRWSLADHTEWAETKRGSVGRALKGIELRVIDPETDEVLEPGLRGLLEVRGDQLRAGDGRWVRTTDLASLDADGFLFIHGRADDAINRGGFKIPPILIEDALRTHPAVLDAAALAIPDDRLGEVPVAAVTLREDVTEAELRDHIRKRLTSYQMPVSIHVFDHLPQTPSMKVSRPALRDRILASQQVS